MSERKTLHDELRKRILALPDVSERPDAGIYEDAFFVNRMWPLTIGKFLVMIIVGTLVLSAIVMLLWNALVPELFSGREITFWQAAGLLILSHILLRGWGRWRYANGWRRDRWKHRLEE